MTHKAVSTRCLRGESGSEIRGSELCVVAVALQRCVGDRSVQVSLGVSEASCAICYQNSTMGTAKRLATSTTTEHPCFALCHSYVQSTTCPWPLFESATAGRAIPC